MVSEFEFIDNIKSKYVLDKIGDDCAVLPKDADTDLLLTADMLVEDIDFRLDWTTPEFLGHKALTVSLSDIAAMGGDPRWAMLSIAVPANVWNTDFLDRFYAGWFELARKYTVELVGGDVSRSPDKLVIDSIVGGEVAKGKAILRSTAKPGDSIFVTGTLGGAAAGLQLLDIGLRYSNFEHDWQLSLIEKQLKPIPRIILAKWLRSYKIATSLIDISDGLSSDLAHICHSSDVGARIFSEKIPINQKLTQSLVSFEDRLDQALNGGEDFELLFTADPGRISELARQSVTCIGEIKESGIEIVTDGKTRPLEAKGYQHFAI